MSLDNIQFLRRLNELVDPELIIQDTPALDFLDNFTTENFGLNDGHTRYIAQTTAIRGQVQKEGVGINTYRRAIQERTAFPIDLARFSIVHSINHYEIDRYNNGNDPSSQFPSGSSRGGVQSANFLQSVYKNIYELLREENNNIILNGSGVGTGFEDDENSIQYGLRTHPNKLQSELISFGNERTWNQLQSAFHSILHRQKTVTQNTINMLDCYLSQDLHSYLLGVVDIQASEKISVMKHIERTNTHVKFIPTANLNRGQSYSRNIPMDQIICVDKQRVKYCSVTAMRSKEWIQESDGFTKYFYTTSGGIWTKDPYGILVVDVPRGEGRTVE